MKLNEMKTKELYKIAQEKNIPNRSKMKKAELIEALKPFFKKVSQYELAKNFIQNHKNKNNRQTFQPLKLKNLQFFASKQTETKNNYRNYIKKCARKFILDNGFRATDSLENIMNTLNDIAIPPKSFMIEDIQKEIRYIKEKELVLS
ncbi:Rho termination factor N-terminal domain-containing protein [Bacillus velezensis]|uniref:Rho termination factor N-terminal domain-containing protein n=1 Tax=Bacillus velezensis TaxID=492670 RepID=UPI0018C4A265|nr:Rho termination factor N-terminal domain-containing protein [Bacillus velezensis]QPK89757.1 Rho termination factor N-terminal domain-containing protein [Bacillus velezensis]